MSALIRDLKVETVLVSALKPYAQNARTHSKKQIQQIADSITEFGFTNPILVDGNNGVIAGHGRLEAAKVLGLTEVPTICLGSMNKAQIRAYVIADNKLAENADWDEGLLALELQGLIELDFDVSLTGFEMGAIDVLIDGLDADGAHDPADEIPEPDETVPPVSRPRDLWLLGPHKLLCADATDPDSYIKLLGNTQAQMVFSDPPFNVPIAGHVSGLGAVKHREFAMASGEMSALEFTRFLTLIFDHLSLFSADGSLHFICMDWRHVSEIMSAGRSVYQDFKNLCVWNKTNAAITSNAMQANAREGFWNGSQPPFGLRTYVAETRGAKEKKKLEAHPEEAALVELIFQLYVHGDGSTGPLGIKNVVNYLNSRHLRNRSGKPFSVQFVGHVLRNEAYYGTCWFNRRDSKTRLEKPRTQWIAVPVPALIDDHIFAAAQEKLDAHHPMKLAPRLANSSVLLTGLATCKQCGGRMKVQTGKSNRYRYYVCARAADEGKARCSGIRIPRDDLDTIVLDNFCGHVLAPERVSKIASGLLARAAKTNQTLLTALRGLEWEKRDMAKKLDHLYAAIENGVALDGSLKTKIASLQERRAQLIHLIAIKQRKLDTPFTKISTTQAAEFSNAIRARLRDRTKPKFARAYLHMMVSRVEVGKTEIRITGRKETLAAQATAFTPNKDPDLTFEQAWRTREDSNSRPLDS